MAKHTSKPLFVDTGYIIASINDNDHFHRQALALSELSFTLGFDRDFCTGRVLISGIEVALCANLKVVTSFLDSRNPDIMDAKVYQQTHAKYLKLDLVCNTVLNTSKQL